MQSIPRLTLALALTILTLPTLAASDKAQKRALKRLDTNQDGVITLDEFQSPRRDRMLNAGTDKDGAISMAEMQAHQAEKMAEHEARLADRMASRLDKFAAMDLDKDGKVTPEEARQAAFNHLDTNKDGQLSADEWRRPGGKEGRHPRDKDGQRTGGKDGHRRHSELDETDETGIGREY